MIKTWITVVGAAILLTVAPLFAHHSFAAEYDRNQPLSLTGKIMEFDLTNPHGWIYVEVIKRDGERVVWEGQTGTANALYRGGWTKQLWESMIKTGEIVTVRGYATKDASSHMFATDLTRADGKTILELSGQP